MKQLLFLMLLLSNFNLYAQCDTCGPTGLQNNRTNITGGIENTVPYDGIFHLQVTRAFVSTNVSTGTFIDNDLIITANHNLMYSPLITKVEIFINGAWVKIPKYKIFHYHQSLLHKKNQDIAILKIADLGQLKNIVHTNFLPYDYSKLANPSGVNFNLTGFPCDRPDTMVEKITTSANLLTDPTNCVFSYKTLYTCTGDSGAPLWFNNSGNYSIVSIHHGGNDFGAFADPDTNVAIKITPSVIAWINLKANKNY